MYFAGGYLAVTDANLVLGRLIPKYFPHIFGEHEDQPLDADGAKSALEQLTTEVSVFTVFTMLSYDHVAVFSSFHCIFAISLYSHCIVAFSPYHCILTELLHPPISLYSHHITILTILLYSHCIAVFSQYHCSFVV